MWEFIHFSSHQGATGIFFAFAKVMRDSPGFIENCAFPESVSFVGFFWYR